MPNSTMNKITEMELSALRSNTSFADRDEPVGGRADQGDGHDRQGAAMTLRKISASRTTMSNRVTTDDDERLLGRLLGVQRLGRRAGHAGAEVVPSTSGSRSARSFLAASKAAGSKAFLPGLTGTKIAAPGRCPRAAGRGAGARVVELAVELLGDGATWAWSSSVSSLAVLAVEDHDRADLAALREGFLLQVGGLDGLVVAGQELRLVLRGLEGRRQRDDQHGEDDPGGDDQPRTTGRDAPESTEHAAHGIDAG